MADANYVLLEKITVGAAGASSVTFSGIPQTGYTDLYIVFSPHTNRGSYANADMSLEINGSTSITSKAVYSAATNTVLTAGLQALMQGGNDALTTNQSLVFGPTTIYFPNYTSSAFKSYSVDFTAEGNTTDMDQVRNGFSAGLWSSTAAINSIKISPNGGTNFVQHSTFYLYGIAKLGTTPAIVPYATGGDTIETDGTYWYHAFLSSGTFTPQKGISCDVLVVAGGGGGGNDFTAGGGAGGYRSTTTSVATAQTVTIGAGGTASANSNGSNSSFGSFAATGGGGAGGTFAVGQPGGSGAGTGISNTAVGAAGNAGSYSPVEGYAGGNGVSSGVPRATGGGGGASAVGGNASGVTNGVGGIGGAGSNAHSSWLSVVGLGVSGFLAGGGGGTGESSGSAGGSGGGGTGGTGGGGAGTAGIANTGGGGGGGGNGGGTHGAGGSGLVIVRYAV